MNATPTAAIGIPAYNAETTIGETLDALQSNPALARIAFVALHDDCSTDRTVETARSHWRSRVPLEVWRNPENMRHLITNGLIGRMAERVEWTFILHADDVVKPNWLSLYLDELPRIPASVATICSSYDSWWPVSRKVIAGEERPELPPVHAVGNRARVLDALERGCWWHLSGCAIRNEAFHEIGGFEQDLRYLADWEWLLRCFAKGYGVWYLPRTTMLYRQHEQSFTSEQFRVGGDIKDRLRILAMMRSQGYLGESEHKRKLRGVLRQLLRRTLVRAMRRDWYSFRNYSLLLRDTGLDYALRKS